MPSRIRGETTMSLSQLNEMIDEAMATADRLNEILDRIEAREEKL